MLSGGKDSTEAAPELIVPPELARRLGLKLGTVYNHLPQLGPDEGVIRIGRRVRINWTVFWPLLAAGKIESWS